MPWHFFPEVRVPKCKTLTQLRSKFVDVVDGTDEERDRSRPHWTTMSLRDYSKCTMPCTASKYKYEERFQLHEGVLYLVHVNF